MDARASEQAQRGRTRVQVASHHDTYVQVGDQLMHASSGISPPPTQNCSKIDVVSSTLTRRQ